MKKNIFIHIGTHKTGTTTIQDALQQTLKKNRKTAFIKTPSCATEIMRAKNYDPDLVNQFHRDLQKKIGSIRLANNIVMSNECLCGLPTNGYRNSNVAYSILRDATADHDVKIIIYLRRQDQFVESMYTQMIHQGEGIDFKTFLKNFESSEALDYLRMINDLSSFFGKENVIIKSYHTAAQEGLLFDFQKTIGSDALKISDQAPKNPSYSRHAVEIAKICNRQLGAKERRQLRQALQVTMAKKKSDPFSFFTHEERTEFQKKYTATNKEIADLFFNGHHDQVFPVLKRQTYPPQNECMTYDEISNLLVHIFKLHEEEKKSRTLTKTQNFFTNIKSKYHTKNKPS